MPSPEDLSKIREIDFNRLGSGLTLPYVQRGKFTDTGEFIPFGEPLHLSEGQNSTNRTGLHTGDDFMGTNAGDGDYLRLGDDHVL